MSLVMARIQYPIQIFNWMTPLGYEYSYNLMYEEIKNFDIGESYGPETQNKDYYY